MNRIHASVAIAAALLSGGCGQKGALVLPDAARPHKKISVSHGTPAKAGASSAATSTGTPPSPSTPAPPASPGNGSAGATPSNP